MKKLQLSTLNLLWFSFVFLFNGCAPSGGGNSSSPDYEGTWLGRCEASEEIEGFYTLEKVVFSSTNFGTHESLTYSDAQCTQRASGLDLIADGPTTIEKGGIVDGKQLMKLNYVLSIIHIEGLFSAFFPVGSILNFSREVYRDKNILYATDGETNLLDGKYVDATQIKHDKYWVKQ